MKTSIKFFCLSLLLAGWSLYADGSTVDITPDSPSFFDLDQPVEEADTLVTPTEHEQSDTDDDDNDDDEDHDDFFSDDSDDDSNDSQQNQDYDDPTPGYAAPDTSSMKSAPNNIADLNEQKNLQPIYNAPYRLNLPGSWTFFTTAKVLVWRPQEEYLYLGYRLPLVPSRDLGDRVNFDFKYKPGFKLGYGKSFPYDNWDVFVEYTWLYSHQTTKTKELANPRGIVPSWDGSVILNGLAKMKGIWTLHTNVVDGILGRKYQVGDRFYAHPFMGIRATVIPQKFTETHYTNGIRSDTRTTQSTWAIGPRFGIDSWFKITDSFRVLSTFALAELYQEFRMYYRAQNNTNPLVLTRQNKRLYKTIIPNTEMSLGFAWGCYLLDNFAHFDISASYDFNVFFNQNELKNFVSRVYEMGSRVGNLYFSGLTFTAKLDF